MHLYPVADTLFNFYLLYHIIAIIATVFLKNDGTSLIIAHYPVLSVLICHNLYVSVFVGSEYIGMTIFQNL